jgi:hypothetical protein
MKFWRPKDMANQRHAGAGDLTYQRCTYIQHELRSAREQQEETRQPRKAQT